MTRTQLSNHYSSNDVILDYEWTQSVSWNWIVVVYA